MKIFFIIKKTSALELKSFMAMVINAFRNKRYGPGCNSQHLHHASLLRASRGEATTEIVRAKRALRSPTGEAWAYFA